MEITLINQLEDQSWEKYVPLFEKIAKRTELVLNLDKNYTVSLILVNNDLIQEINRDYRGIDRSTDVISFALKDSEVDYEMMDGEDELGDVFINVEAVVKQAMEYGHSEEREIGFLFTHGLLHLNGFDHLEEDQEKIMFTLQDKIIDEIVKK